MKSKFLVKEGRKFQKRNPVCLLQKIVIKPQQQEILYAKIDVSKKLEGHTGIVIPDEAFEESTDLKLSSAVVKVGKENNISIIAINLSEHNVTITKNKQIAVFQFLSPQDEEELIEIGPDLLALDKMKDGEIFNSVNQILSTGKVHGKSQPKRPPPDYDEIWFPTSETCPNPENLPSFQRKIYDNITELQQRDTLDPQQNSGDRETFLKQFDWSKSALTAEQIQEMQELLVEYNDIFAKHRFNVGYNTELKVKLTPAHDLPVYVQSPPTPILLRDEILVELALMQYYGIVTLLPNSKYSSPIFAQRKSSGKLRILIDLRRVNHLLRNDYSKQ